MPKLTLTSLIVSVVAVLMMSGCAVQKEQTIKFGEVPAATHSSAEVVKVRASARKMYQLVLNGSAKKFCEFAAPTSVLSMKAQFPHSSLGAKQICVLLTSVAFAKFKKTPEAQQLLQDSLDLVAETPISFKDGKALMGEGSSYTSFQRSNGQWRPIIPNFLIPHGHDLPDPGTDPEVTPEVSNLSQV